MRTPAIIAAPNPVYPLTPRKHSKRHIEIVKGVSERTCTTLEDGQSVSVETY